MIDIEELCDHARYSDVLQGLLERLHAKEMLRLKFDSDYQGFVDCSVLLEDGKVFSYKYWYGSCSGCDEWESDDLTEDQIAQRMLSEATFFENIEQYNTWRAGCENDDDDD